MKYNCRNKIIRFNNIYLYQKKVKCKCMCVLELCRDVDI